MTLLDKKELESLIKDIKSIFKEAKLAKLNQDGTFEDISWERKIAGAIVKSRKNCFTEFSEEIFLYFKYPDDYIQEQVMNTLGWKFRVPSFKEECYKIFIDTSRDDSVRDCALENWIYYYHCTYDKGVLEILYKNLINDDEELVDIKRTSYYGILSVCCIEDSKAASLSYTGIIEKVNKRIDWDYIHELMKKHAPQVDLIDPSQFDPRTPRKVER